MKLNFLAAALPLVLAACASPAPPVAVSVPDALKASATEVPLATLAARGVQIYECRVKKGEAGATEWAFVAPEAELFDASGQRVGKHYAGPHWESVDGSKVVGSVKARADAPTADAIPWLLLSAKSDGPDGAFAKITGVQRIRTVGGVAPSAATCTTAALGTPARVPYTADYVMLGSR